MTMLTAYDQFKSARSLFIKQAVATRGLDKIQPTRTISTRSDMESFTEHSCEAGYHSHGDRKCHPVTDKHNGEAIQGMGGEYMYRLLHPSLTFEQPQYNTAFAKMRTTPEYALFMKQIMVDNHHHHHDELLMKQGQYDPCPGNDLHGHQGYQGCHSAQQKHRKNTIMALGGWDAYVSWHPFMAGQPNPYEDEGNAKQKPKSKTTKPKGEGKGAKQTPTRTRTDGHSATGSGTPEIPTESTEGLAGSEQNGERELKPADKRLPRPTKTSELQRDKEESQLVFDGHDPKAKFGSKKAKKDYIDGLLKKNAVEVEYNEELLNDMNPYMLASDQPLASYGLLQKDGRINKETMYAGQFRARAEIDKWNAISRYSRSLGQTKKDALGKVTTSEVGTDDWKLGMVMLFIQQSGLRIGNETNVEKHGTYGISTLRPRHVSVKGSTVSVNFSGKKMTVNDTSFNLPKRVAAELNTYMRGLNQNDENTIWGGTELKNNRGNPYSWEQNYSQYVKKEYGFSAHRVRAYSMTSGMIDAYVKNKIHEIPEKKDREEAFMHHIRQIATEHGSSSATSAVEKYTPFEMVQKLVDGSSVRNANGFIDAHLSAMRKEDKAMTDMRKKGGSRRRKK